MGANWKHKRGDLVVTTKKFNNEPAGTKLVVSGVNERNGWLEVTGCDGLAHSPFAEEASIAIPPPEVGMHVRWADHSTYHGEIETVLGIYEDLVYLAGSRSRAPQQNFLDNGGWFLSRWGTEIIPVAQARIPTIPVNGQTVGQAGQALRVAAGGGLEPFTPEPTLDVHLLARVLFANDHDAEARERGEEGSPSGIGRAEALRRMWAADEPRRGRYVAQAKAMLDGYRGVGLA